ncbi:adenosylcobinamide-phosphate synthase CbiB [Xylanibacter oryzae]|uniref:adenosylcobinamide-phosphate synthase CbiB n=1 Tax=Xylanibacter oryzae TaxID=185293 RepID=UPI0004AD8114|nr:adenosylcobinamide-phosphate synthase CbiB [Xylanibacter oryzae]
MNLFDIICSNIKCFKIILVPVFSINFPLIFAWLLDLVFGDPIWFPHPVVLFGKIISFGNKCLNKGRYRKIKGAFMAAILVVLVYILISLLVYICNKYFFKKPYVDIVVETLIIFSCLAGTTLIREVRNVFFALDRSLDEGRSQVSRIVGRDTSNLSAQEVRKAALETLAENLSDGVIAPLFWYLILGVSGMLAYKMINTLDSMIGYRTIRYKEFGCFAAHMDDVANYIPARLTACLMALVGTIINKRSIIYTIKFIKRYGRNHASPNSGYPESALAGILDCQFGGPHYYFGEYFHKPFIGYNDRQLSTIDMKKAVKINRVAEAIMIMSVILLHSLLNSFS